MQHHWKKFEKLVDGWNDEQVQDFLTAGNHRPSGSIKQKKEFIKDVEYNWIIDATDSDMATVYPQIK